MLDILEAFEVTSDADPFLFRSLDADPDTTSQPGSVEAAELGLRAGGAREGWASDSDVALSLAATSARASSLSSAPPTDDAPVSAHSGVFEELVELLELVASERL